MAGLPPGINLADNIQGDIIGSISATWALATVVITMRLACRRISKAGFWWDDYLMIPAYVCGFLGGLEQTMLMNRRFSHPSCHGSQLLG